MNTIAFIDTEVDSQTKKVLDFGGVKNDGDNFHQTLPVAFAHFIKGVQFICGHNILNHDINYISDQLDEAGISSDNIIDTLYLSPLLFPSKPYHALVKDDKLQYDDLNNPLNDAIKARDLFFDEIAVFNQTDSELKDIYFLLLSNEKHFRAFFQFLTYKAPNIDLVTLINQRFDCEICANVNLSKFISEYPVELAYSLSLINADNKSSITPRWALKNYPEIERLLFLLRNKPCISGCSYCTKALDAHQGLKKHFGFDTFRSYGGQPLQQNAVEAALHNKSLLCVFPTGGGKSITFQLPALMAGENTKALTIIISPLQSLMKDQVDNLEKISITSAVTINGLLDPIERAKSFERIEDGSAYILYISPESLRSKTIVRLLLGRKIARFVIDEAHCFSAWGQDFRVDYLYIADFIKNIQKKKNLLESIPVSCFTATAKPKVIEDICTYFADKLDLQLELFASSASRTNLHYRVLAKPNDEEKYLAVRDIISEKNCPAIVYVSRRKKTIELAQKLSADGFQAKPLSWKIGS